MNIRIAESANRFETDEVEREGKTVVFDARRALAALRRQRWVVAAWVVALLILGVASVATTPPGYKAWASVLLTGEISNNIDEVTDVQSSIVDEITIENALQVLHSQRLALRVTDDLQLWTDPRFMDEKPSGPAILIGQLRGGVRSLIGLVRPAASVEADDTQDDTDAEQAALRLSAAGTLESRIRIGRVGRSSAVTLGIETQSPELSAAIVNAYVAGYAEDVIEANQAANEQASEWLSQRLAELGANSQEAATAVQRFRSANGLVDSGEGLVSTDSVRQLNQEYSLALAEVAQNRAVVGAYDTLLAVGPDAIGDADARVLLPDGNASISTLRQDYDALLARRDAVVESFGVDHPEAVRLSAEVATAADRLYDEVVQAAAAARGDLDVAIGRVAAMAETLGGAVETNATAGEALVELRALEQRAETVANLYEAMLVQAERANQQRTLPVSDVRTLAQASVPLSPSSPSTVRTLAVAILFGLIAAALHGTLREWKDRFVRTDEDVVGSIGERFLGYLPEIEKPRQAAKSAPAAAVMPRTAAGSLGESLALPDPPATVPLALPVLLQPHSQFTETLRGLRLASELAWGGEGGRIIGVTSVRPGEGKSTLALNLAAVLASGGQRTLLVDADLRQASLTGQLGLAGRRGLGSVVLSDAPLGSAVSRIAGTTVEALGCESRHGGSVPYDLLSSPRLHRILAEARQNYRCVVLDLAPLGAVVDARLLLGAVDQIILVAEWGKTPRRLIAHTLAQEANLRHRMLGIVLNRVDLKALPRYASPDTQSVFDVNYGVDPEPSR